MDKKTSKKHTIHNNVLIAAIDDLLGIHKDVEKVLTPTKTSKGSKQLTQEEKDILKHYEEGIQKTMDIIAPAGMEIRNTELVLNDVYARTLYVYNWPNYIFPNWLSSIINFDAELIISHFIYPSSNKIIMKMLRKKVTELRASIRILEQRGIVRDPTLEAALQDAEELRDLLARGREKLFQFGMYVTFYADDMEKLKKIQTDIESLLGGKLVLTKPAIFQMEHAWISTLPLCLDELEINRGMNTSPLATSFPFSSADLTDDHGILYGINRHNDSLVIFDRFDLPNANSTVFAISGAGKSYTVKLELLRSLMFHTEVFVLDPENEYVALAEAVGGTHIPISLQSDNAINPFDLPKAVRGEDAKPGETLRAAAINLHGLFKLMLGTLTPAEDGILDKAILDTYALKDITMDTENAGELEPPTLHDLVDVLSTTEGGEHMAQTLSKYTEGSYAGIFDRHTNVELENQMIVFQIRDLEDQLRPIAMYIILNFLWNRIRAELKRRILVVDEAWNLLQYEDSARFLYGLIKRARKYYLGVTTITQDVEDFVNSPYGKPIITNSSFQVLLKQSASAVDNLQKLFYLTDGEKYLLLNSDVGQGLFFAGNKHVAIQVVASPEEDKLVTTKPSEVLDKEADAAFEQSEVIETEVVETPSEAKEEVQPEVEKAADTPAEPVTPEASNTSSDEGIDVVAELEAKEEPIAEEDLETTEEVTEGDNEEADNLPDPFANDDDQPEPEVIPENDEESKEPNQKLLDAIATITAGKQTPAAKSEKATESSNPYLNMLKSKQESEEESEGEEEEADQST